MSIQINRCNLSFNLSLCTPLPMLNLYAHSLADPRGGARDARPPWGSKFFHFHAVFGKKLKNNSTFGSWRPPWGKSWIRHCHYPTNRGWIGDNKVSNTSYVMEFFRTFTIGISTSELTGVVSVIPKLRIH